MGAISQLRVEIDDEIKQNSTLLLSVEQATEYFDRLCGHYANVFGENRVLVWQQQASTEGVRLAAAYNEEDEYGDRHVTRFIRVADMADPVNRDTAMGQLIQSVLRQRWDQVDKVTRRHLREIDQEESDGHAD